MTTRAAWLATPSIIDGFLAECKEGAENPSKFATFRRGPIMGSVIENRPLAWMPRFLGPIENILGNLARSREVADRCDRVGSPDTVEHDGKVMGATTAYYLMCYAACRFLFGSLAGMRIVEIGGGFGGQAAVITGMEAVGSYTIIDLPEVCLLQREYLRHVGCEVACVGSLDGLSESFDLVISSCALSELDEVGRSAYAALLRKSGRGWLAWNFPPEPTPGWLGEPEALVWLTAQLAPVPVYWGRSVMPYAEIIGDWSQYHFYWGDKIRT